MHGTTIKKITALLLVRGP